MTLEHDQLLGDPYYCSSGTGQNEYFYLYNLDFYGGQKLGVVMRGNSAFLTRDKVEELATTLLFWLDQTEPGKEAQ